MKTIGILGGLGPQATMDFEERLHRVSQKLIPQHANEGYPKIITYFFRQKPFKASPDGSPETPFQVNPELLKAAKELSTLCDFIVMPSNTPYFFIDDIQQASGKKVLSILEATKDEVKRRGVKTVGLISIGTTLKNKLYQNKLAELNLNWITFPEDSAEELDKYIFQTMEGKSSKEGRDFTLKLIEDLRNQGTEAIVIGCTEVPILLGEKLVADDLINPAQLLAEATIKYALV
jgi:aspartate racemase